jgi:GNAT superfamily N-acetyltransferase
MRDRYLRFGASLAPQAIAAYVDGMDCTHDAVFGLHDDRLVLVGLVHLACNDDLAEVGLSVLPAHRGRGVGTALFRRAVAHACFRCIPRLIMRFLSSNVPIIRIARRFGMSIVTAAGESSAHLELTHLELTHPELTRASLAGCGSWWRG